MTRAIVPWGNTQIEIGQNGGDLPLLRRISRDHLPSLFFRDHEHERLVILQNVLSHNCVWEFWGPQKEDAFQKFCRAQGIVTSVPNLHIEENLALLSYSLKGLGSQQIDAVFNYLEAQVDPITRARVSNAIKYYDDKVDTHDFVLGIRLQSGSDRSLKGAMVDKILRGIGRAVRVRVGDGPEAKHVECMLTLPDLNDAPPYPQLFPDVMFAIIYLMPVVHDPNMGTVGRKKDYLDPITQAETIKLQRDALRTHLKDWARAHDPLQGDDLVVVGDTLAEAVLGLTTHPTLIEAAKRRQYAYLHARDVTPSGGRALPKPTRS